MTRGIAVTQNGQVVYAEEIAIAKGGVAIRPRRIVIACGGLAREVWPPTLDAAPEGLQLSDRLVTARDIRRFGGPIDDTPVDGDPGPGVPDDPNPGDPPPEEGPDVSDNLATWFEFFGDAFASVQNYRQQLIINDEGVAIRFTVDSRLQPSAMVVQTLLVQGAYSATPRFVSVSTTPLDFVGIAAQTQTTGHQFVMRLSGSNYVPSNVDPRLLQVVTLAPGTYYLNLRNERALPLSNFINVEATYRVG